MNKKIHFILACLFLWSFSLSAAERILSYDSDIQINKDGSMNVVETIEVKAEGKRIKRGIYRDFPTQYKDHLGNKYNTTFSVISVFRDGKTEPYHTENRTNGVRVYVGSRNVILKPNTYTYEITYRTNYQLGFFDTHDELYWNVTGNGWAFPIAEASARVTLPENVRANEITVEAYTGYLGAKGSAYEASVTSDGKSEFQTTKSLSAGENITIVMTWPKGVVVEPSAAEKRTRFLKNNQHYMIAGFGLLGLFTYFFIAWFKVGRDPGQGVIYPRYNPPEGYSPDELRYIKRMGYDNKTFTTAIVDLATRGYLKILEDQAFFSKDYKLRVDNKLAPLNDKDRLITQKLFDGGFGTLELDDKNHRKIKSAMDKHQRYLAKRYKNKYFFTNTPYFIIGILLSIFLIFMTLTSLNQSGGSVLVVPVVVVSVLIICFAFYHLLKAPTIASRSLLDQIDGFIEYMEIAEGDELKDAGAPELTPKLYEKYLPYALALGVELSWAEKFTQVFARLARERSDYQPSWFDGHSFNINSMNSFSSNLSSSFNSAISSSSTPPGSSSGSGGGGFSGGGGGGGGGGGW